MLHYLEPAISGITSPIHVKPHQICWSLNTKLKQYKIYNAAGKYANNIQICHFLPLPLSSFHFLTFLMLILISQWNFSRLFCTNNLK